MDVEIIFRKCLTLSSPLEGEKNSICARVTLYLGCICSWSVSIIVEGKGQGCFYDECIQ